MMDVFLKGDVYLDFPHESDKFRHEKATGKVSRRFYGQAEDEIPFTSKLFKQAICEGRQITRDEYFR